MYGARRGKGLTKPASISSCNAEPQWNRYDWTLTHIKTRQSQESVVWMICVP